MVWPALLPPWIRTTMSARFDSQSMILPLPSSPHWAPITVTLDMDIPYPEEAAQPVGARARWGLIAGVGRCVRDHPPHPQIRLERRSAGERSTGPFARSASLRGA